MTPDPLKIYSLAECSKERFATVMVSVGDGELVYVVKGCLVSREFYFGVIWRMFKDGDRAHEVMAFLLGKDNG
jgi:hypothetical protein